MKVLLIHNKDITMEYLENILESKCIRSEVIVALPDAFTLEVMRNIHFDIVIGSIHGYCVGMMEDFLAKVKLMENENDIYTYMGVDKETLGTLDQEFLDVVDDFISIPIDPEEFGYRLAKAAKRVMKRKDAEAFTGQNEIVTQSTMPDMSSPEMKLLDNNIQEVSIKDILQNEDIEPEDMDADSQFLDDANFSSMEAESDDAELEVVSRVPDVAVTPDEHETDQFIADILKIEFQAEPDVEDFGTGIEEIGIEAIEVEIEAEEVEAEAVEVETEEVEVEAEGIEPELEEAKAYEKETEAVVILEPTYDELLKARELRREKEKAELERQERIKWEKIGEAAKVISKESIPVEGSKTTYGEQVVGASIIVGTGSFSTFESEDVTSSANGEDTDEAVNDDEPSYEELLKAREIRMEMEKAEKERQERIKWESIEENAQMASQEEVSVVDKGLSYHEQVVRAAVSGMPESLAESGLEAAVLPTDRVDAEEIPCEPSYEDLVLERESRMQKEQEEARRQSMAKKFSGFNLADEDAEEEGTSESAMPPTIHPEEHRASSKAETIQEEIDLLKHLRKDYNVKTSKVNSAKFKKEKKNIAAKRQKKASKSTGLVAKVTRVFVFLLIVAITTLAIFVIKEKIEGRDPVVAGYRLVSFANDVWIRYFR